MTVSELIQLLSMYPDDTEVLVCSREWKSSDSITSTAWNSSFENYPATITLYGEEAP